MADLSSVALRSQRVIRAMNAGVSLAKGSLIEGKRDFTSYFLRVISNGMIPGSLEETLENEHVKIASYVPKHEP